MATEQTNPAVPDFETIARNANQLAEVFRQSAAASLKPFEQAGVKLPGPKLQGSDEIDEMTRTLTRVAETWLKDPEKALQAQTKLTHSFAALWASTLTRMHGAPATPIV